MRGIVHLLGAALALALALGAAGPAAADRPEYVLSLRCRVPTVALGEEIPLAVRLEKRRGRPVTVHALRLAESSVSFEVRGGGRSHTVTRIHAAITIPDDGPPRVVRQDPPEDTLRRGHPLTLSLPLLAVLPGKLSIRALYTGLPGPPRRLASEPVEVTVSLPEGKKEIAAVLETSLGSMLLRFRPDRMYNTVLNFLTLAKEGMYDGLTFHRVVRGVLAQGGDPKGNGTGGPDWYIPGEFAGGQHHEKGVISMVHAPGLPDTAGSQFFLLLSTRPELDGKYAAFGKVVEGLEVLDRIGGVETVPGPGDRPGRATKPKKPLVIRSIRVIVR